MGHHLLTPSLVESARVIIDWAESYLTKEHAEIKRPQGSQTVCPFVGPALQSDCLYFAFHPEVGDHVQEEQLEEIIADYIPKFNKLGPFDKRSIIALCVVFPHIPAKQTKVLDIAHQNLKDRFVKEGLMLGQFHPNCDERAVYNSAFKVSVAPVPLIAMRRMSIHDILFLGANEEWFVAYSSRFGAKFDKNEIEEHDKHLVKLYFDAKRKWIGN
jgi:hypothetical protein